MLLATCYLLLVSCKREKTTWADDFVAPLATGNLTLGNLFPDTVIKANNDSSLSISFNSNLINYQVDSLLKIHDTTITTHALDTFGYRGPIHPGDLLFPTNQTPNTYNLPNGIQLRKAIVKQGKIKVVMYNTVNDTLIYTYQLPSATKNNVALTQVFTIPKRINSTTPGILTVYIDLAGYTIDFTGTGNQTNTILQGGQVNVAPASMAHNDSLFPNQGLISNFTFQGIVPQYALGYFGSQTINVGPDTTVFNVFNSIKKGLLNLNSASVVFTVTNQFGVDMQANISSIQSINTNNPSTLPLINNPNQLNNIYVPAAHDVNGPNNPKDSVSPSPRVITFNNSNSNIKDFIGNLPNKLSYKLTAQVNPFGNTSGNNDFAYNGTGFIAALNMNVPLYFSASNLMLADTVSMDLSGVSQLQNINKGNLILTATNSYPFSINLSATLLDANKQALAPLFSSPGLIQVPVLDSHGKVTSPLTSKLYIPLTPQKITALQKAKYVSYTATFNTANQPSQVKFYSNYTLGLLLTADINYTVGK